MRQEDIDRAIAKGGREKSRFCMYAEAIKRRYLKLSNVMVDKNNVRVTDAEQGIVYTFPMSPLGRVHLLKFDAGEAVGPNTINLKHPVIRNRIINKKGQSRIKNSEDCAKLHIGAMRRPTSKEGSRMMGRDRIFGQRLFPDELRNLRETLGIPSSIGSVDEAIPQSEVSRFANS